MYNKRFFMFICLILLVIIPILGGCSNEISLDKPKAIEGILDLTTWKLDHEVIKLDGQWEFYWKQLLKPGEFKNSSIAKTGYINIPSSWLTPARIFTTFNSIYQIFSFIVIVYLVFVFIKIILQKEKSIGLIIVGALTLILTSLNDMVFLSIWMNDRGSTFLRSIFKTGNLSSVGQLIFVFANSLVLAQKFSIALEQEEVMTAQLKEINLNLDKLVIKRTEALEESRKKIVYQKIELEKANIFLQLLSLRDPLTNLWNRRHYDDTINVEWKRCLRNKVPISLMMVDIDHFKSYNDSYGHMAGDECLIKVAEVIKSCFNGASDLVARYGGEEFIIIMPELGKEKAIKMAMKLQKNVEDLHIPHSQSSICPWVTASIGVTSIVPDDEYSVEGLFLAVDKALYSAKSLGRNRVEFVG